jgi:hypothetical protein
MTRTDLAAWAALPALILLSAGARAQQPLAQRVSAVNGDAEVRFASRPDVCGDGDRSFSFRSDDHWNGRCMHGPVRVRLTVANGAVTHLRTYVGEPRDSGTAAVTDLGTVSTHDAVEYFLSLARAANTPERVAADAILPAALADSTTISPALLSLARDRARPTDVRKRALFWAGEAGEPGVLEPVRAIALDTADEDAMRQQAVFVLSQLPDSSGAPALIAIARDAAAGMHTRKQALFWAGQTGTPTSELVDLYRQLGDHHELRKQLIFVLSQRSDSASTDALMNIARSQDDYELRKQAMFWLGQKNDPRVASFLASILEH